jgi:hypothetical protein
MHDPSIGLSLYNFYIMFMTMHLRVGVHWNLDAFRSPLQEYPIYPNERKVNDSILCLVL